MAASAPTSVPMWLTGMTYDGDGGNDLRNSMITALTYPLGPAAGSSAGVLSGVLGARGLAVSAASGMTVDVQGGSFLVAATVAANGGYTATLASQATLTVTASDSVNPRIDLVCATVTDNGDSTSSGVVQVIPGTPASSPAAPSLPATSIPLAHVAVAALSTSVVSGNITDLRTYTCASGGILHAPIASPPAGIQGQYAYDAASDALYHNANAGPRQARTLPFAPVHTLLPGVSAIAVTGAPTSVTATVTTDGSTDLKITARLGSVSQVSGSTTGLRVVFISVYVDSALVDSSQAGCWLFGSGNVSNGFEVTAYTSAAASNTPAAGSHTIRLDYLIDATGNTLKTPPTSSCSYLRVEPVVL